MSRFAFEEATHTYTIDGSPVPSVSHVLQAAGLSPDYSRINPAILKHAADRGIYVEQACRLDDLEELDEERLAPGTLPYIQAWREFRTEFTRPFEYQVRLYHPGLLYAGTADVVTGNAVLDIKCTTKIAPAYRVQVAAYTMPGLQREDGSEHVRTMRGVVQLLPTGKFVYEVYSGIEDEDVFRAALQIARWKAAA